MEWLAAVDPTLPSIMAAREFGGQPDLWQFDRANLLARNWLEVGDLAWEPDEAVRAGGAVAWAAERLRAFGIIRAEIEELQMLMQDDRDRHLAEAEAQSDGLSDYIIHFIGASQARHPWTIELISCGLAIGNIVYMYYKAYFKRVRPSFLCPGLTLSFGSPAHAAFPSGHSFLGHFIALLLLEIPGIAQRYGIFNVLDGSAGTTPVQASLSGSNAIASPLLWLAQRLAWNREVVGLHYKTDTWGGRHLAAGIWWALLHAPNNRIVCPTLETVLRRATAEWPTPWP
jgi:membrane-associated phospholipid phosphatase